MESWNHLHHLEWPHGITYTNQYGVLYTYTNASSVEYGTDNAHTSTYGNTITPKRQ